MDASVVRKRLDRALPRFEQPLSLRGRHHRQRVDARIRILYNARQELLEVREEPLGRTGDEQVGVEVERAREPVLGAAQVQAQLEQRHAGVLDLRGPSRQPREIELGQRRVLDGEECLEQRCTAQVPSGLEFLHQSLKGQVLVLVGAQRGVAHLRQQLTEAPPRRQARAQHQRVDEEANQAFRLRVAPARDGRAHQHVVLPGVPGQHGLERRQQHHEGRGAFSLGQRLHGFAQRQRQPHRDGRAVVAQHRRARLVRGQLQRVRRTL
ncbi:hypothetical protein GCM10012319_59670 [Comamonas sp. KCTC 72670]|nr:hypothetical protein GCM10012319_59670 [Comamonas sp. KCTC 72670]